MLGFNTLWEEPWLFGVAVWPGILMARPLLGRFFNPGPANTASPAAEGDR
jgi:hypothetical protein